MGASFFFPGVTCTTTIKASLKVGRAIVLGYPHNSSVAFAFIFFIVADRSTLVQVEALTEAARSDNSDELKTLQQIEVSIPTKVYDLAKVDSQHVVASSKSTRNILIVLLMMSKLSFVFATLQLH